MAPSAVAADARRTPAVEVFEKYKDAVVFVTGPVVSANGSKLAEFFKLQQKKQEKSVGTGFLIHESGYVVTNAHGAERIITHQVVLSDAKRHPAELVATIRNEDVALLKIDAGRPLVAARLARSGDLLIGEPVIVISNPHGLMYTCTTGVLSAVRRRTNLLDVKGVTLHDMIQTDAAINPGSSGGPWFNAVGEVIGLTASMKRDAENIGFAVSVASLRRLLPGMLDVERRYGIDTGLTVSADGPCLVETVGTDSPAAKAGIQKGDVLTQVADTATPTALDFHLALIGHKAGETLSVALLRREEPLRATLTLGRRPKPDAAALLTQKLGLSAEPLDESKARATALRVARGVVITQVDPNRYRGLDQKPVPGDVLARINGIRPRDLDHLGLILDRIEPGQQVPLVLLRRKDTTATRIDMNVTLPK
jgi:serine protease Do